MITIDDELLRNYRAECAEQLAIMEQSLISLESGQAAIEGAAVEQLLRAAHSVQAGAQLCGLTKIDELAQRMERALAPIGQDRAVPPVQCVTALLRAIDTLRALLDAPGCGAEADISEIKGALAGLVVAARGSATTRRSADWRLRTLLVEDDFTSRLLLQTFLSRYGECHVAVNGKEAVAAFRIALEQGQRYDLICMDIMMPEMDGGEAVRQIRAMEEARGILSTDGAKIFMTTAVSGLKSVMHSFRDLCDAYLVKPIDLGQLVGHMKKYDLVG